MVKKGVLVLILLTLFLSAAPENSSAKNSPRLVDKQDNMHPWGGDDNSNTGVIKVDNYNPISYGDYRLHYNYGSKSNLISGILTVALDEIRYFFFGITAASSQPRDRTTDGSPTSSGLTQPVSGSSGGRSGR